MNSWVQPSKQRPTDRTQWIVSRPGAGGRWVSKIMLPVSGLGSRNTRRERKRPIRSLHKWSCRCSAWRNRTLHAKYTKNCIACCPKASITANANAAIQVTCSISAKSLSSVRSISRRVAHCYRRTHHEEPESRHEQH